MKKLLLATILILFSSSAFAGEIDGKGLWCDNSKSFFFKNDSFAVFMANRSFEHKMVIDFNQTSYKTTDDQIVLYLKEYKMTLYLDRTTLTLNRWILDNISVQCEVIGNEKLFKERLSKEDKKLKKIHEHLLKKRKI